MHFQLCTVCHVFIKKPLIWYEVVDSIYGADNVTSNRHFAFTLGLHKENTLVDALLLHFVIVLSINF